MAGNASVMKRVNRPRLPSIGPKWSVVRKPRRTAPTRDARAVPLLLPLLAWKLRRIGRNKDVRAALLPPLVPKPRRIGRNKDVDLRRVPRLPPLVPRITCFRAAITMSAEPPIKAARCPVRRMEIGKNAATINQWNQSLATQPGPQKPGCFMF